MTLYRFTLVLIFIPFIISGQVLLDTTEQREIYLDHLGIEDGMSQGMINDLVIDQDGYMWIATKEGLNRYDGKKFKVFRHNPKDPLSISDNLITSLFVDSKNNLWVGTDLNGLNFFDRKTESFNHFNTDSKPKQKLSSSSIGKIFEDPKGNIIIQTKSGNGYDILVPDSTNTPNNFRIYPIQNIYPGLRKVTGKDCCTKHLYFKSNGEAWYYGLDSVYSIQNPELENASYHSYPNNISSSEIYFENQFIFDPKTEDFYLLSNSIIEKYDTISRQFLPYLKLPLRLTNIHDLFIDNKSRLWIAFRNNKYLNINLQEKKLVSFIANSEGFNEQGFCCTFFKHHDQNDNLWIGTGGFGALKWSSVSQKFETITIKNNSANLVWDYRVSKPGSKAVFSKDIKEKWGKIKDSVSLKAGHQFASRQSNITIDNNGFIYVNLINTKSDSNFLLQIDTNTYGVNVLEMRTTPIDKWYFTPIFIDKKNNIWYSERSKGDSLQLFNHLIESDSIIEYTVPVKPQESVYRFVHDWYENKNGSFWLGTTQGLFLFNPEKNKWKHYQYDPSNDSSLSLDMVLSVCPDPANPEKYIWAGTNGSGLNRLNIKTGNFTIFNEAQGLPNNVVYAIQTDHKNNLWLSTNKGLSHFNIAENKFVNYNTNHGLAGNEFNRYEFSKASDGTLYFGGVNGVVAFHPKYFYTDSTYSNAIINQFKILNTSVNYKDTLIFENERFYLKKPIEQLEKLELNYNHRMFSFGFSVLDFTAQKSNKIKYKLEGFHKDWIEADINHEATFTNLDPGYYTLKVLGYNSSHQWSEKPRTLQLTILPPWWGTWWFRGFMVFLFAGILYSIYRYRLGYVLRMERMRNQIAQDLHDDIGSTLSSISVYSTAIQKSANQLPEKVNHILGKIIEGTTETMERMNDMVWAIKADNDTFKQVILRMYALAVDITEVQGIQLQFNADEASENIEMNMLERKNIYLIYKEALNNTIKYAQCDIIEINVQSIDQKLHIEIKDNGIGFETGKNTYNMGGNGIAGMQKRAQEIGAKLNIQSKINNGTTIQIIF
ncbi:MAG: two-component regulator propeller domain-containing protein [Chitinophagales bacterium]